MYDYYDSQFSEKLKRERLYLGFTQKSLAKELDISEPTLKLRIENPKKFTIENIYKLRKLGFKIKI